MLQSLLNAVTSMMDALGAPGVGLAMLIEATFALPPSEVILPLAGFTASTGAYTWVEAVIWATVGAIGGSLILYWIGAAISEERLLNWVDKVPMFSRKDVEKAMDYFDRHGSASVFIARFIPGIRALICLPAGLDRMKMAPYLIWTTLGCFIWNIVLIYLGFQLGDNYTKVTAGFEKYSLVLEIIMGIALIWFIVWLVRRYRKDKAAGIKVE